LIEKGETIFSIAREYFAACGSAHGKVGFRFFHTSFDDFVRSLLVESAETEFCQRLLAQACAVWNNSLLADYAINNRFSHVLQLTEWCEPFARVFTDGAFIEKVLSGGNDCRLTDVLKQAVSQIDSRGDGSDSAWRKDLSAWGTFLDERLSAPSRASKRNLLCYAQEVVNEFLTPESDNEKIVRNRLHRLLKPIKSRQ
jgi:hypothetical protein